MKLTRYPAASIREILSLSMPLMVTSLSWFAMVFVDRLFLAAYDLQAMNAAVSGSIVAWTFINGAAAIASIAQVFVGRKFGAGDLKGLGAPVWQMLWYSLFSFLFYLPLGFFGGSLIFGQGREMETIYFDWMVFFGPMYLAYQAVVSFFVGQGKIALIVWVAVITNGVNFFLDYLLIFGFGDLIPSLGIEGAAIATSLSTVFETGALFYFFINKRNRRRFGTGEWKIQWPLFSECIWIGIPAGVSMTLEFFGWSVFYEMMKWFGDNHLTIAGIFQSLMVLFYFIPEGLLKGMTVIIAFYIGEKREGLIPKALYSCLQFVFTLFVFALVTSPLTVEWIRLGFLNGEGIEIDALLLGAWILVLLYITFEAFRSAMTAHLTAYKETGFILGTGVASVLLFIVFPFLLLYAWGQPAELTALFLALLFPLGHALLLYLRSRRLMAKERKAVDLE